MESGYHGEAAQVACLCTGSRSHPVKHDSSRKQVLVTKLLNNAINDFDANKSTRSKGTRYNQGPVC